MGDKEPTTVDPVDTLNPAFQRDGDELFHFFRSGSPKGRRYNDHVEVDLGEGFLRDGKGQDSADEEYENRDEISEDVLAREKPEEREFAGIPIVLHRVTPSQARSPPTEAFWFT